jgi:transcriptional regulator with XRE-family HTH domain
MVEEINRRAICAAVAQILQKERTRRKLTLAAVAAKSGLSYQMIRFVESQRRNPTLDTLLRICGAMEIELLDVLKRANRLPKK